MKRKDCLRAFPLHCVPLWADSERVLALICDLVHALVIGAPSPSVKLCFVIFLVKLGTCNDLRRGEGRCFSFLVPLYQNKISGGGTESRKRKSVAMTVREG